MSDKFNTSFNDSGEKPRFIYKRNPLIAHAFQIFMYKDEKGAYEPVGEYTLLDTTEDLEITEKTVMNIISLLNGRENLIKIDSLTENKLLFNIVPKTDENDPTKIIFRTHDGKGVSTENAVLILEKGVLHEANISTSGKKQP
ncbi:MAG: hypothetical protein KDI46_05110 [Alphaproteobacteria bacterium]|nr:hypothetical protein [Alphaproteobacteria bacterium]